MNFYKHHIGDYLKKTAHLTLAEHGAYLLMLQTYYATETPLPKGEALYRVLRATTKLEREAVTAILRQYWIETSDGYVNDRADEEIALAQRQREVNRVVGKRGGNPYQAEQHGQPGHLYAAAIGGGQIRIGATVNVSKRMYGLARSHGRGVTLVHSVPVSDMGGCLEDLLAKYAAIADGEVLRWGDGSTAKLVDEMEAIRHPNRLANASPIQTPDSRLQSLSPKPISTSCVISSFDAAKITRANAEDRDEFEAIKAAYPPNAGRTDWITAEHHIRRHIDAGATWEQIREGVERYARHVAATNRMVLNPARFFGDGDRPWAQAWPIPPSKAQKAQDTNVAAAQAWLERANAAG